jgi:hypothetical protein
MIRMDAELPIADQRESRDGVTGVFSQLQMALVAASREKRTCFCRGTSFVCL